MGYFSPGPGIFVAKNETEMRDRTEIGLSGEVTIMPAIKVDGASFSFVVGDK